MNRKKIRAGFLILLALPLLAAGRFVFLGPGPSVVRHIVTQEGYFDYQGVIHFHTGYSGDATGTFEAIAGEAGKEEIDFLISTDHDTMKPLEDGKEGYYGKTLVLVGEELSLPEGYLLALGHQKLVKGGPTGDLIDQVNRQGGFVVIAHPDHPRWKWKKEGDRGISGEEILDFADQWYSAPVSRLAVALFAYPFNWRAGLLNIYQRPDETLARWDARNKYGNRMTGIFAPDFHQALRVTGSYKFPFPPAEKILPIAHDHILLERPLRGNLPDDRRRVYEAIRMGRLFVAMDILGNGAGFNFTAAQGSRKAMMGDTLPSGTMTFFSIRLPSLPSGERRRIRLLRDGKEIGASEGGRFTFSDSAPGVYRVEVEAGIPSFFGGTRQVVWIYSNPICLK